MSFLESIPLIGDIFKGCKDVASELIEDSDALNKIIEAINKAHKDVEIHMYLAGLNTKTIPWVDALHKMGRQISNFLLIIIVAIALFLDKEITGPLALLMGGGNLAYQLVKGKGK